MDAPADLIRRLHEHVRWADRRSLTSLEQAGHAPERAVRVFAHILGSEATWLSRIESVPATIPVWPEEDLQSLRGIMEQVHSQYQDYLADITSDHLSHGVRYVNSAGDAFESSVSDILTHVAVHGAYHRGQVAMLLRDAGEEPIPTGLIAFARGAPAATRQSG